MPTLGLSLKLGWLKDLALLLKPKFWKTQIRKTHSTKTVYIQGRLIFYVYYNNVDVFDVSYQIYLIRDWREIWLK